MADTTSIRVNFGKPMAFFPLAAVSLVPHGVVQLHIFEPRYRQMVSDALDEAGQIAMAVFDGEAWQEEYHGAPPVRPMMCVGQIVAHEALADGRFNIALQGGVPGPGGGGVAAGGGPDVSHGDARAGVD